MRNRGTFLSVLLAFAACSGGTSDDTTPPSVLNISPVDEGFLPVEESIRVTFSEGMDSASIDDSTFTISPAVDGTVAVSGANASFTPSAALGANVTSPVTLDGSVTDMSGNALGDDYVWTFTAKVRPPAPTNVTAVGELNLITLTWTASAGVDGYDVFRSGDEGETYDKLAELLTDTSYEDVIDSPEGDGVLYRYIVVSVKDVNSLDSDIAKGMHGTRLAASYPAGYSLGTDGPYVVEGDVEIRGGNLTIGSGKQLYVLDDSAIDIGDTYMIDVAGLLHVSADTDHPATFASGNTLVDNNGFRIQIQDSAVDYDAVTGSGTLIQNTTISDLRGGSWAIRIGNAAPRLSDLNMTVNSDAGTGPIEILDGSAATISHVTGTNTYLSIVGTPAAGFKAELNQFRDGVYALRFANADSPVLTSDQVVNNDFDGSLDVLLSGISGSTAIPLGGNYWAGGMGTPPLADVTGGTVDFTTALSAAPATAGATW